MSTLTDIEKRYLEKLLGMQSGYVLDYSDATYGEFFGRHGVDIHGDRFQTYGTSKAKKMRAFWERRFYEYFATINFNVQRKNILYKGYCLNLN